MDIRVINGEGEIVNVSRMHITVNNQYLIALTEDMKSTITIERCKDEEEATQFLRWIKEAIKCAMEEESDNVLIDLESEDAEDGKRQDS
jgi:ArsR family metal-binding transcriptional regulator